MSDEIKLMKKQIRGNIQFLIDDNKLEQAMGLMDKYVKIDSKDIEIYSMKAVVFIMQGKMDNAEEVLKQGLAIDDKNFDLNYNLGYLYENEEKFNQSISCYKKAIENCKDEEMKVDITELIMKISSEHNITYVEDKKKIVFFVKQGLDSFLGDVIEGLSSEYETKKIVVTEYDQVDEGMKWADICWFEWCDELIGYGSRLDLARQKKIICRLHRYEALTEYPKNVMWENVDKLVIVTRHLKNFLISQIPDIDQKVDIMTINNGVNLDKFQFKKRNCGFNIAYVGYIHQRKNPVLLLQTINKLVKKDKRYKLYIAGQFQDALIELYWNYQVQQMGLQENVIFQGWQEDINKWLEDKNCILSTSIHESFGYGIAEAMARGIKPVIHNFLFANEIWPKDYLFNSIDEAVEMITCKEYSSKQYRQFIENNYSLDKQINMFKKLLNNVLKQHKEESNNDLTIDYIRKVFNNLLTYDKEYYNEYDFNTAQIMFGKREKINDDFELIEFAIKNSNNKILLIENIWYNVKNNDFIIPKEILQSDSSRYIYKFLNEITQYNIEYINNIAGFIFDKNIKEDVETNYLAYNWERAIPCSQFMPVLGYLKIAERYLFAGSFIKPHHKILEAPCGFGYGAAYFSKLCSQVETLDLANENIEFSKRAYNYKNINWTTGDVTDLIYKDNEFDVYVSYEVFEHLPLELIEKYLSETKRVIKNGGKFIISTPNRDTRKHINNPFHIKEYTFNEFKDLLNKYFDKIDYYSVSNFKVEKGMKNTAFNMIAVCEK